MAGIKKSTFLIGLVIFSTINIGMKCASSGTCLPARSLEVTVIKKLDVPRSCRTGFLKERSAAPSDPTNGFCGIIFTDYGPFKFPESSWSNTDGQREALVDALVEGCRYAITYRGGRYQFQDFVEPGAKSRNRGVPVLLRIDSVLGCNEEN
jgi:hypothetical protein